MFTGKGDRADRWVAMVADSWGDKPVEVFGMNYPGAGGSDSPGKLTEVLPAALGVYDAVQAAAGTRRVFIQAASFGTAVALAVAARRPVSGLILQNPVPLRQLLVGHYGWWNLWLAAVPVAARVPPELGSIENAKHVTAPAVFISSGNDEVVPPLFHRLVIDGYAGPKRLIEMPGASHAAALTAAAAAELQVDRDWLWNHDAITPGNTGSP
jgi:pimeloyl-ACP methyl ester carboxylesterase